MGKGLNIVYLQMFFSMVFIWLYPQQNCVAIAYSDDFWGCWTKHYFYTHSYDFIGIDFNNTPYFAIPTTEYPFL